MIEARELHPVRFFEKGDHKPAATKDFRPRPIVNEQELEEKEETEGDSLEEEETTPDDETTEKDEETPDPAPEPQARRAAKD